MTAQGHRSVEVAVIDETAVEHRLTKLLKGQSPQFTTGLATAPHRDSAGSVYVGEACRLEEAVYASTDGCVEALAVREDRRMRVEHTGEDGGGVRIHCWIGDSGYEVQFLEDEPATRSQSPYQASQRLDWVGEPRQHQPGMDQIEAAGR